MGTQSETTRLVVAVCTLLVAAWIGEALKVEECGDFVDPRLSKAIQPEHYKLDVLVDPNVSEFKGQVNIDVRHNENWDDGRCDKLAAQDWPNLLVCDERRIILGFYHTMKLGGIEYEETDSKALIPVQYVCRSTKQDLIVIKLTRKISPGSRGQLRIGYQSEIRDDHTGLFRAKYRDLASGQLKNVIATHFQPGYARRAYPCFDEPDFKATFELGIFHPSNLRAISNTHVATTQGAIKWEDKEFSRTEFGRTPKMSTYLLSFAVGEFDYIESKVDDKMTIGMYTPPGRSEEARGQMTTAVQAYKLLRDFFGVEQPISKLDFVSIREFPAAMENWGMIVFEETLLLANRNQLDAGYVNHARDTLIHEISHQWFGNLVTMKWWDDLWLNEGFAQWMGTKISEQLYPQVGANSIWMLTRRRRALDMDANPAKTHPIKNSALQTLDEIQATFDHITYDKGQSVIKMLNTYLGHKTFKQGLREYMKKHAFGNTEDTDLWQVLTETSGVDVRNFMRSWLHKPGFPLIEVRVSEGRLKMRQSRFGAPETLQTWVVPILMRVSDGKGRLELYTFALSTQTGEVQLPEWFDIRKPGHWLKLNAESEGFYFTKYDRKLYAALQRPIETKTMSPVDRYNILEESLGKLRAYQIELGEFLSLLGWFKGEDDDATISLICVILDYLKADYEHNASLFPSLLSHLERHGLEDDKSDKDNLMKLFSRGSVLYTLVDSNYKPAVKRSLEQFAKTNGKVPGFLQDGIHLAVAIAGTDEQFRQVASSLAKLEPGANKRSRKRRLLTGRHTLTYERKQIIEAC